MSSSHFTVRFSPARDIAAVEARSGQSFARHSHDEFGIGVITQGAQRSWSGRGMVEAGQGDVITVNPGEIHDGAPIGGERSWSMLYFSPDLIASVVADLSEGKSLTRELQAPVVRDAKARARFWALHAEKNDETLLLLFACLMGDAREGETGAGAHLRQVRERIDDDPAAAHPLEELAALAGLSRFQTIRHFERLSGLTPHAYIIQRRLDLARRLIREGLGLAETAAEAGFADQSHLHRAFIARYGLTPGTYAGAISSNNLSRTSR